MFSQVSGYMGKRMVVEYDNYFFPAFKGPGLFNSGPRSNFNPGMNTVSCLNLDYTAKNRLNYFVTIQYLRTGIAYKTRSTSLGGGSGTNTGGLVYPYPNESTADAPNGFSAPSTSRYGGDFSKPAILSSVNFGGGIKLFKQGCLAPIGSYIKLELLGILRNCKIRQ